MTIELTPEEIEIIEGWYDSAAGESATDRDAPMFALLDKLGIHACQSDLWTHNPMDTKEEYRQEIIESNDAIKAYCDRHPDYEEVQDVVIDELAYKVNQ